MTALQAADALGITPNGARSTAARLGVKFSPAKLGRSSLRAQDGGLPRQAILKAMGSRTLAASELATIIGIEPKRVRYHLGVLLKAGSVTCETNTTRGYLWRKVTVT